MLHEQRVVLCAPWSAVASFLLLNSHDQNSALSHLFLDFRRFQVCSHNRRYQVTVVTVQSDGIENDDTIFDTEHCVCMCVLGYECLSAECMRENYKTISAPGISVGQVKKKDDHFIQLHLGGVVQFTGSIKQL